MDTPPTVINGVATLLKPYGIDFVEMLQQHRLVANESAQSEEWLTLKEAARFAKVSVWTVRRWCGKGVVSKVFIKREGGLSRNEDQ